MVVIGLEFAFNRIPFRLFHFVYSCLVTLMYILGNYIGFLINPKRNATYSDLIDWTDNDAGFFLGTIETLSARVLKLIKIVFSSIDISTRLKLFGLGGSIVIHCILYGLYQLKMLVYKSCCKNTVDITEF